LSRITAVHRGETDSSIFKLFDKLEQLQEQLDKYYCSVNSRFDKISSVSIPQPSVNDVRTSSEDIDRSRNIVLFGVEEHRDISVWRGAVDSILKFIVGRDVDVDDSFRLGKYQAGKIRPILVKLKTAWDRRLILQGRRKLTEYESRVFVSPDESLATRRQNTFKRLITRAEKDGKSVEYTDDGDKLIIDSIPTFSLTTGYLTNN
jgi:hypothetical protein